MSNIKNYNTNPNNNGSVLATGSMLEGQNPSSVNDAMRQICSDLRVFYNDPQWIEFGIGNGSTTYTRVDSTTVTIGANVIEQYHAGRRVKIVDGTSTTIYGTITSSTFNSPNTTIVMSFDDGASIGSGTITSFKIGAVSATNTSSPTNVATGGIIMWTASTLPDGWLLADGSLVNKSDYAGLFAILGNTYGTATSTQFYLPNLTDKFVIGKGSTYGLATTGGVSSITPSGTNSALTFTGNSFTPSGSISGTVAGHAITQAQLPNITITPLQRAKTEDKGVLNRGSSSGAGASYEFLDIPLGGSGQAHSHGFSGSFSGNSVTPSGSINTPTFTGNSASIINPYIALSYIIKT